jgi:hypothetical protein
MAARRLFFNRDLPEQMLSKSDSKMLNIQQANLADTSRVVNSEDNR